MISLPDRASLEGASHLPVDERLRPILLDRIRHYAMQGLLDLTHLLIIQPGDTEEAIRGEVGFSPLINPYDGVRFGSPGFHPSWDGLKQQDGWFEFIVAVGNGGFAFVLFIQDADGVLPGLLSLCRTYSE